MKKINSLLMLLLCLFISNKTLAQGTIVDVAVGNENFSTSFGLPTSTNRQHDGRK